MSLMLPNLEQSAVEEEKIVREKKKSCLLHHQDKTHTQKWLKKSELEFKMTEPEKFSENHKRSWDPTDGRTYLVSCDSAIFRRTERESTYIPFHIKSKYLRLVPAVWRNQKNVGTRFLNLTFVRGCPWILVPELKRSWIFYTSDHIFLRRRNNR